MATEKFKTIHSFVRKNYIPSKIDIDFLQRVYGYEPRFTPAQPDFTHVRRGPTMDELISTMFKPQTEAEKYADQIAGTKGIDNITGMRTIESSLAVWW